jgi:TPR repeat protein
MERGNGKVSWACLTAEERLLGEEMIALWTRCAEQGHAISMFNLGAISIEGWGVEKNTEIGIQWYHRSAAGGNDEAPTRIAFFQKERPSEEFRWMMLAAERGNTGAQIFVGEHLFWGQGVQQDRESALRWVRLAASATGTKPRDLMFRRASSLVLERFEAAQRTVSL